MLVGMEVREEMATTLELAQGICDLMRNSPATLRERHSAMRIAMDMYALKADATGTESESASQSAAQPL